MNLWYLVIGMGLITFALRLTMILGVNRLQLPAPVQQSLRFAAPAVLSAIIVLELAAPGGDINLSLSNPRLIAGSVAALIAWRTKSVLLTIVVGMILLWLLQWVAAP